MLLHRTASSRKNAVPDSAGLEPAFSEQFSCVCGDWFASSELAVAHVRRSHVSSRRMAQDPDVLKRIAEALILPAPVFEEEDERAA
jgi:hypothetical protein